jgi:hypothetical protein
MMCVMRVNLLEIILCFYHKKKEVPPCFSLTRTPDKRYSIIHLHKG